MPSTTTTTTLIEVSAKGLFLQDIIISKRALTPEHPPIQDQTQVWVVWRTHDVLHLLLHIVKGVETVHFQSNRLSCPSLYEDLHRNQMQPPLLFNLITLWLSIFVSFLDWIDIVQLELNPNVWHVFNNSYRSNHHSVIIPSKIQSHKAKLVWNRSVELVLGDFNYNTYQELKHDTKARHNRIR